MRVEAPAYRTPTGQVMVLCPCRIKARVLKTGRLQRHYSYEEELPGVVCEYSGARYELAGFEVLGFLAGAILADDET